MKVPSNIQEGLAHLELEATHPKNVGSQPTSGQNSPGMPPSNYPPAQRQSGGSGYSGSQDNSNASGYRPMSQQYQPGHGSALPSPKFSPFPKPRNAGPNIPPSDEDKEAILERARTSVVSSTDPEEQLDWAQDALAYVEIAQEDALRNELGGAPARPHTPHIEHELREEAVGIVRHLANQRHPKAEFMVATWYEFAKFGFPEDKREAFDGFTRSAAKGYPRAEYRIGMQFEETGDMTQAIQHYNTGVAMGDAAAHYRMGMMTMLGQHDQLQDWRRGIDLVRFAADAADENAPQGAYVYGMLLARELPNIDPPDDYLPYDVFGAKQYIEKAAFLGFSKAQLKMSQAYELCQLGCEFDPVLSLHYGALASRQGEAEADMAISKWFLCGYEGAFDKNEELAFVYAKRAAQTNMSTAEFALGYFYEVGIYVPVDLEQARVWYQRAADHGNGEAIQRVDSIVKNRTLSKTDHEQVALTRIKSRYGSQRGARPSRFKERLSSLPATSEEQPNQPDPNRRSPGRNQQPPYPPPEIRHAETMPAGYRPRSSGRGAGAPYPEDNIPPAVRPPSTAPYPDDDDSHLGYYNSNLNPSHGPLADRPASAFGLVGHGNNGPSPRGSLVPGGQMRPSSSMSNLAGPDGRGNYGGGRTVSGGWDSQGPGNYRGPPSPGYPPRGSSAYPSHGGPPSPGLAPPFDSRPGPSNYDQGPNKLRKASPSRPNQPPSSQGYGRPPDQGQDLHPAPLKRPDRMSSLPPQQQQEDYSRFSRVGQPPRPQRIDSAPRPTQQGQSGPGGPRPGPGPGATGGGTAAGAPKPERKGPSTFEEMGIPTAKQDSECVVM
ncbi:hypothetical protein DH86_00002088 [Scytalidium sp. 3C]|nr:hypothetical protein DH86_00002088 [Scytalidium sp. 3C]